MSRYGGTKYVDDIADMVAMPSMAPLFRTEGHEGTLTWDNDPSCGEESLTVDLPEDGACRHFRAYDDEGNIPMDRAAAYAKLRMLRDLDVITQEAFDECVGPVGFEVPGPGFNIYSNDTFLSSFDQGVTASIGTDEGAGVYVFLMNAEGQASFSDEMFDATMTLRLNLGPASEDLSKISWPRGGFRFVQFQGNENNFILDMPDAPAGSFEAMEGFALVTASSAERIEGSVVLQKVWRPFAPVPVPEVYDPPLVIRFLIDK